MKKITLKPEFYMTVAREIFSPIFFYVASPTPKMERYPLYCTPCFHAMFSPWLFVAGGKTTRKGGDSLLFSVWELRVIALA